MITRRGFLRGMTALLASGAGLSAYALGIEPFRLNTTRYRLTPPGWPRSLRLKIAVLADIHACDPWMKASHIRSIVAATNAEKPDVTLLLGDYVVAHRWISERVPSFEWASALAGLTAPLGVHAVLGNHDWWDDAVAQSRGHGPTESERALTSVGIAVYHNRALRLSHAGQPFWLAGLGDQIALRRRGSKPTHSRGLHDLAGTLAQVTDTAPVILMAHEPNIYPKVPPRVSLTISGHTHGGQIRLLGRTVSPYGHEPWVYGHYVEPPSARFPESERHFIVSGGLGCSVMPIRFGIPPEVVIIELGADTA